MPDHNQTQQQEVRFRFAQSRVSAVFGNQSHLTPSVFAAAALGWNEGRTFKHTSPKSTKKFPLPLTRVGARQMVSAVDFFDFIFNGSNTNTSAQQEVAPKEKKKVGRKSNEFKAAAAQVGGDHE